MILCSAICIRAFPQFIAEGLDWGTFYSAGVLVRANEFAAIYTRGILNPPFVYPPHSLPIFLLFGWISEELSLVLFFLSKSIALISIPFLAERLLSGTFTPAAKAQDWAGVSSNEKTLKVSSETLAFLLGVLAVVGVLGPLEEDFRVGNLHTFFLAFSLGIACWVRGHRYFQATLGVSFLCILKPHFLILEIPILLFAWKQSQQRKSGVQSKRSFLKTLPLLSKHVLSFFSLQILFLAFFIFLSKGDAHRCLLSWTDLIKVPLAGPEDLGNLSLGALAVRFALYLVQENDTRSGINLLWGLGSLLSLAPVFVWGRSSAEARNTPPLAKPKSQRLSILTGFSASAFVLSAGLPVVWYPYQIYFFWSLLLLLSLGSFFGSNLSPNANEGMKLKTDTDPFPWSQGSFLIWICGSLLILLTQRDWARALGLSTIGGIFCWIWIGIFSSYRPLKSERTGRDARLPFMSLLLGPVRPSLQLTLLGLSGGLLFFFAHQGFTRTLHSSKQIFPQGLLSEEVRIKRLNPPHTPPLTYVLKTDRISDQANLKWFPVLGLPGFERAVLFPSIKSQPPFPSSPLLLERSN